MFKATFIGHQGWLLETDETRLLVDPLLADTFGNTPGSEARVYPPRDIQFDQFPSITAVMITHEHEDHLCPAALDRLSRDIPIYLSGNSSASAATIVQEMGFEVRRVHPGQAFTLGTLTVLALGPYHDRHESSDEWDVMPFVAWDERGHGSFFSSVDVATTDEMLANARANVPQLGTLTLSWNSLHIGWRMLDAKPPDAFNLSRALAQNILDMHRRVSRIWSEPQAIAVTGSGFSLQGDMEWMNRNAFVVDIEQVVESVRQLGLPSVLLAPRPGQALVQEKTRPCRVTSRDFLRPAPRQQWPDRTYVGDQPMLGADYAPTCGKRAASEEERRTLELHLKELAQYLYGTRVFQELLSLRADELGNRRRSIALVLKREDGPDWIFEYDPRQCRFLPRKEANPFTAYPAGIECWATDLLALFDGSVVASSGVGLGRARIWSAIPGRLQGLYTQVFVRFFHPLRRPEPALALYRRLWHMVQEQRVEGPRIPVQRG